MSHCSDSCKVALVYLAVILRALILDMQWARQNYCMPTIEHAVFVDQSQHANQQDTQSIHVRRQFSAFIDLSRSGDH